MLANRICVSLVLCEAIDSDFLVSIPKTASYIV